MAWLGLAWLAVDIIVVAAAASAAGVSCGYHDRYIDMDITCGGNAIYRHPVVCIWFDTTAWLPLLTFFSSFTSALTRFFDMVCTRVEIIWLFCWQSSPG